MQKMTFMVTLYVPDSQDPENVRRDLKTSVGFGRPVIELLTVVPMRDDEETP